MDTHIKNLSEYRVAIVHDWLTGYRGGERVLEQLCRLFPNADIHTLIYKKGSIGNPIESKNIFTSFLNKLPAVHNYYRWLLPFYPLATEKLDLSSYQLVISISHCTAKGVIVNPDCTHICYCLTPVRYAWDKYNDYFLKKPLEFLMAPIIHYLRLWDVTSSQRVDEFIGISKWVQKRIQKYYRRDSKLVYPPVDTSTFQPKSDTSKYGKNYYLVVSALVPYKRIDLAIKACHQSKRKLLVVGSGSENLSESFSSPYVHFLGRVPLADLPVLYSNANALIFPGEEDFGITPLESQACGTPVIAYNRGGVCETVINGKTGLFFKEQTIQCLIEALEQFEKNKTSYIPEQCEKQARKFSNEIFLNDFTKTITQLLAKHQDQQAVNPNSPSLNQ